MNEPNNNTPPVNASAVDAVVVWQPSEINEILEEKYEHRKDIDNAGWTGFYKLEAKEIIDIVNELKNSKVI